MEFSEILVDLREAVLQVARHFINVDPKSNNVGLVADYSMESHAKDHDNYVNVSRTRKRRAKALLGLETFFNIVFHAYEKFYFWYYIKINKSKVREI